MIPDLAYININLNTFNQVKSRLTYLLSGLNVISLNNRGFCYLVNTLTFTKSIIELIILIKLMSI